MKTLLYLTDKYVFFWRGQKPPEEIAGSVYTCAYRFAFCSVPQARQLLALFGPALDMRSLLSVRHGIQTVTWDQSRIQERACELLQTGELLVERRWMQSSNGKARPAQPPPLPVRRTISVPPSVTLPPTFSRSNNSEAQAASLLNAAVTGAPFCEECEKAKQILQTQSVTGASND